MPEYKFLCNNCEATFWKSATMFDFRKYSKRWKCAECNSAKIERDFSEDNISAMVKPHITEVKTVGHYAEKNEKKLGKYQVEDMRNGFKTVAEGGMEELPSGMSRVEKASDFIDNNTKGTVKKKAASKKKE